jgi:glutamine synthetase
MAASNLNEELEAYLKDHPETRYLEALIADMNGILRGKRAEREDFHKLFGNGMNLCASTTILDSRGCTFDSIPYGVNDGDPDGKGLAVPGSLGPVPWVAAPTAQVLVEMMNTDGTPYPRDPRNVLRRALQPLTDMGLKPVLATELEFYLVEHVTGRFQPKMPRIPGSELPQPGLQYAMMEDLYEVDGRRLGIRAGPIRSQPPPRGRPGTGLRPRGPAQTRHQGGRRQKRTGGHVHGQTLRRVGRLRTARPHQPAGCRRRQHFRRREPRWDLFRAAATPTPTAAMRPAISCRRARPGAPTTAVWRCGSRWRRRPIPASNTAWPAPTPIPTSWWPPCWPAFTTA